MKKQIVKHCIQFGAALSLCAAVMVGVPSGNGGTPDPEPGNGQPGTIIVVPGKGDIPDNPPDITPLDNNIPIKVQHG